MSAAQVVWVTLTLDELEVLVEAVEETGVGGRGFAAYLRAELGRLRCTRCAGELPPEGSDLCGCG